MADLKFSNTFPVTQKRLLVIIPDRLSVLIKKGEITNRYYNPGNLFDEVHILMINSDRPEILELQKTVGKASLFIHNLPFTVKDFLSTLGMRPRLLARWATPATALAQQIQPDLIRCHGDGLNIFLAYQIKSQLNIPYLVSLHINADEDHRPSLKQSIFGYLYEKKRIEALKGADRVLPVYQSIIPYLEKRGVKNYEVAYNVLNPRNIIAKEDYNLHTPVKLISVGRHFELKNPKNIITAMKEFPEAVFTLVGHGPFQQRLENLAERLNIAEQVKFIHSIANDQLCKILPSFDIFVIHSQHWELSKAVLEALLTGLPVIINRRDGEPIPELQGAPVLLVNNSVEGYTNGIRKLIEDDSVRSQLGKKAKAYASKHWTPSKTEARYVAIYKEILYKVRKP